MTLIHANNPGSQPLPIICLFCTSASEYTWWIVIDHLLIPFTTKWNELNSMNTYPPVCTYLWVTNIAFLCPFFFRMVDDVWSNWHVWNQKTLGKYLDWCWKDTRRFQHFHLLTFLSGYTGHCFLKSMVRMDRKVVGEPQGYYYPHLIYLSLNSYG